MPSETNPREVHTDSIPTRHSLISRIKDPKDQRSWADFFETYHRLIYSVAVKSGLTNEEADEVVQETMLSVTNTIGEFDTDSNRGSFKAWLLKLTRWRIIDQARKRKPADAARRSGGDADDNASMIERLPDPAADTIDRVWEAEWATYLLQTALSKVKSQVRPKAFQVYQLCTLEEVPAPQVAQQLGVSKVNVHVMVHRVNRLVKKEIRALEKLL
ncbi:MAG: RNA polymerase sigma factor (sigma-70 family) [Verrucomicrobiales bacterium]|jgi:RNA polymerase sigma factor (sigma-70 family)